MTRNNFYTDEELKEFNFKSLGKNVKISRLASIYKPEFMSIGSNVRIEDFCILNGTIDIGNDVMVCAYCILDGNSGIKIGNNVSFAVKVSVHSGSDDYSGNSLYGCFAPKELRFLRKFGCVNIENHCLIGDSVVIMPNITISEGSSIGAFSFVNSSTDSWCLYAGIPARKIREKSHKVIDLYNSIK